MTLPTPISRHRTDSHERESESVPALLRRLTHELSRLLRQELALAGAELIQTLDRILSAAAGVAAGGAVVFAGLLALMAAAILGLSNVVAPWLAALLIGGGATVAGVVVMVVAVRRLRPDSLLPRRSMRSLVKDKEVLSRRPS